MSSYDDLEPKGFLSGRVAGRKTYNRLAGQRTKREIERAIKAGLVTQPAVAKEIGVSVQAVRYHATSKGGWAAWVARVRASL